MIETQAIEEAAANLSKAYETRLEKEAVAAYRAGYSHLLVNRHGMRGRKLSRDDLSETATIRASFIPLHEDPGDGWFFQEYRQEVFDLTVLDDREAYEKITSELTRLSG